MDGNSVVQLLLCGIVDKLVDGGAHFMLGRCVGVCMPGYRRRPNIRSGPIRGLYLCRIFLCPYRLSLLLFLFLCPFRTAGRCMHCPREV